MTNTSMLLSEQISRLPKLTVPSRCKTCMARIGEPIESIGHIATKFHSEESESMTSSVIGKQGHNGESAAKMAS